MIAIDLRSLMGGKISGVENYLINILRHLPKNSDSFGFYNSYSDAQMPELPEGLETKRTRIPNKILNFLQTFFALPKLESLYGKFNVLWMPDLRPFAINKSTKLVVTVHDLSPVLHPEFYSWKRRIWHRVIRHKKSLQRADLIFAVSEYTKYDLIKLFSLDANKIKVIYQGIDHARFKRDLDNDRKHEIRAKYKLPEKFIFSISTVEPRKNLNALISAFEQVRDPNLYLVIAGRLGWVFGDFQEQLRNSPKADRIIYLNYIPEQDKPYLYSLALMVCYPSFYEGFGVVPAEAMACGVPVITSARTSMPEVCQDAALLVEPYQSADLVLAIEDLLHDPQLRDNLIAKGLARAAQFSWEKCALEINKYLLELQ